MTYRFRAQRLQPLAVALLATAALTIAVGRPARSQEASDRFTTAAQKLMTALNNGDQTALSALFTPLFQKSWSTTANTDAVSRLQSAVGKITTVGQPSVTGSTASVRLTAERGTLNALITLDAQGMISGLYLTPVPPAPPVPSRNTTPLRLPANGEWYVFWGGATAAQNYHVNDRAQQRALDMVMTDNVGQTHKLFGMENTDYYAYGQDVLAPANATVVTVVDGIPDNTPGIPNTEMALGNHITMRFAENEYGVLAYLQPGSIKVKPGDQVKAGQVLAKVGDSGNITEPFLHFHLQNTPSLQDGTGFAPYFQNLLVYKNGFQPMADYSPVRGDRIRPQ